MTRTNIVIDEILVGKAKKLTGLKTIREVVGFALEELVRHRRQRDILNLRGQVDWEGSLSDMRRKKRLS